MKPGDMVKINCLRRPTLRSTELEAHPFFAHTRVGSFDHSKVPMFSCRDVGLVLDIQRLQRNTYELPVDYVYVISRNGVGWLNCMDIEVTK